MKGSVRANVVVVVGEGIELALKLSERVGGRLLCGALTSISRGVPTYYGDTVRLTL